MAEYDHLVVGQGIIGASIALRLARAGGKVLCLGDPQGDLSSASLAAGAMLGAFGEHTADKVSLADNYEAEWRIESARLYASFLAGIREITRDELAIARGTFVVANAAGKDDIRNIDAIFALAKEKGEVAEWVDETVVPGYRPHRAFRPHKVLHLPDEASVPAAALLSAVRRAGEKSGVKFLLSPVHRLQRAGGVCRGVVLADGRAISAATTVIAAGYGSRDILHDLRQEGLGLPEILGGKGSSMLLQSKVQVPSVIRTPNRDFACGTHLLSQGDGILYVGATNRISDTPGEQSGVTLGELHVQAHSVLHEINTSIRTDSVISVRAGSRPLTSDGFPLVGTTEIPGLLVATGTYRNGVLLAPVVADTIHADTYSSGGSNSIFGPKRRSDLLDAKGVTPGLRRGVKDLISFIQEPHGLLPYERSLELERFISGILYAVGSSDDQAIAQLEEIRAVVRDGSRAEAVPELYYRLATREI